MPKLSALVRRLRASWRSAALLGGDAAAIALSLALAGGLTLPDRGTPADLAWLVAALWAVRLPLHLNYGLHRWTYRGPAGWEAGRIAKATLLGTLGFAVVLFVSPLAAGLPVGRGVGLLAAEAALTALFVTLLRALRRVAQGRGEETTPYARWIREFEGGDEGGVEARLASLATRPLVSVLVPVYRSHLPFLDRAIGSVRAQSYPDWELVLVDDGSRSPDIDGLFERHTREDARIRFDRLQTNQGISAASNRALALARGTLVALLDHDDELAPDALLHLVDAIDRNPEADVLYSDEDHIDDDGHRRDPFFKPDWSPDLILAENYVCHLMAFRRSLAQEVGGFRSEADGSQDHDLLLRMSAKARAIVHVPRILYHWRTDVEPLFRSRVSFDDSRVLASSRRAVEDYLHFADSRARVEEGRWHGRWRIRYPVPAGLQVAIVVSSAGVREALRRCLDSIAERTAYPRYRVSVAHEPISRNALAREVVEGSPPTAFLLFLREEIEVLGGDWLTSMLELAARPEVGVVGAKLVDPDDRIQHAGIVLGLFGMAGHAFRGCAHESRVYRDFPDLVRNVSAVTGDCLLIRAGLFFDLEGFDEARLGLAGQAIDLCLRVQENGLRVLYDPYAVLRHHGAAARVAGPLGIGPEERLTLVARWADRLARDPFYSPNLATDTEDYGLPERPRRP